MTTTPREAAIEREVDWWGVRRVYGTDTYTLTIEDRKALSPASPSPSPEGWVLVPRDQTPKMREACRSASMAVCGSDLSDEEMDHVIWSAQLSAAPAQLNADEEGEG